jgi:hypothetical protein
METRLNGCSAEWLLDGPRRRRPRVERIALTAKVRRVFLRTFDTRLATSIRRWRTLDCEVAIECKRLMRCKPRDFLHVPDFLQWRVSSEISRT